MGWWKWARSNLVDGQVVWIMPQIIAWWRKTGQRNQLALDYRFSHDIGYGYKYLNAFKDHLPSLLTGGKAVVMQAFRPYDSARLR
jgi:hypothetical protein